EAARNVARQGGQRWRAESNLVARTGASAVDQRPKLPLSSEPTMNEWADTPVLCLSSGEHSSLREKMFRAAAKSGVCASALPDLNIVHCFAGAEPIEMQGPCVLMVCAWRARVTIAGSIHPLRTDEQLTLCVPLDLQIEPESCAAEPLEL